LLPKKYQEDFKKNISLRFQIFTLAPFYSHSRVFLKTTDYFSSVQSLQHPSCSHKLIHTAMLNCQGRPQVKRMRQMKSMFECLPPELRNAIYQITLVAKEGRAVYYTVRYRQRRKFRTCESYQINDVIIGIEPACATLGLGLLGPVCKLIYTEAQSIFWGSNHFVIGDMFSVGDLFHVNHIATRIRRLTLYLQRVEFAHQSCGSPISVLHDLQKLPHLSELHLWCRFSQLINEKCILTSGAGHLTMDFRDIPFFAQLPQLPVLQRFYLLNDLDGFGFVVHDPDRQEWLHASTMLVATWMEQKLAHGRTVYLSLESSDASKSQELSRENPIHMGKFYCFSYTRNM
jgi:hypothetical protein